ncbi:MAG: hypothetical protein ILA26_05110 [Methanobrevibacter sp.]|uniref:hypothetical protein n=1 Tax=Methanobrevibacter sp. TaxID=66852 RepID=UPI001B768C51|nr:hypothetical protein [Methanobrevibacter sp.]MBP3225896.1 hypothetical protein [Methanobrevibacter sp.]MBP3791391.1 hypothetical protein [Methanobrevibacter sp.]
MRRKIIIILAIFAICMVLASPAFAKEKVKVKISTDDHPFKDKAFIVIKLVDSKGRAIHSKGTIHYNITDSHGFYKWAYKPYNGEIRLKYDVGKYNVNVKFDGDSHYKKAEKIKNIDLKNTGSFNAYTYYDNHNWGLNQEIDDYIEDNYWDEEIYDDPYTYDGEGY